LRKRKIYKINKISRSRSSDLPLGENLQDLQDFAKRSEAGDKKDDET